MSYLLDTCVISDFFKKVPRVIERLEMIEPRDVNISSITVMEIEYGLKINPDREKKIRPLWNSLINQIQVISFCSRCACEAAYLRAELKNGGIPIGHYDILIAGTAKAHDLKIISSNENEFRRLLNIQTENWRN